MSVPTVTVSLAAKVLVKMVAPVTDKVPPMEVLPVAPVIVNLFVLIATLPSVAILALIVVTA